MTSRVWRLLLVMLLVCMSALPSSAQDGAVREPRRIKHFVIPQGQSETRISDRDKISPEVMDLVRRADCSLDNVWPQLSIHVFRPAYSQIIALVPCGGVLSKSIALTFLRPGGQPRLMVFPIISYPDGIGTTHMPGFLEWNAESKNLVATQRSDMCPSLSRRYTYRYQDLGYQEQASLSWVLLRAEVAHYSCGGKDKWMTYWEAPTGPRLPGPD